MSVLRAVLGPTNTGKTHHALETLGRYQSGMIGFPLRLLARENYDRLVEKFGRVKVALITGEEKIIPANTRYYVCTVESMPVSEPVECVVIDEIQLAADPERGHVFTDRLLRLRGSRETLFLGAETMRPILSRLCPDCRIETRPRLSTLRHSGVGKLPRLKKRSAIVAFSVEDVYAIAEQVKNTQGGAAIVLGALSPRTRNAQVEMFQSGEVDTLVATDAIGMGLNMDIDHVALAATRKYDGKRVRPLWPDEIGQIAGRAGRYTQDGTFGTIWKAPELSPDMVEAIENHRYDPLPHIFWRNARLDFRSVAALRRSLEADSDNPLLKKGRPGMDLLTLRALSRNPDIVATVKTPDRVAELWEVCQIPDFRKTLSDVHIRLAEQILLRLHRGTLEDDWINSHVSRLDQIQGDADALMARIAHIRTWTYISHRNHWLHDPKHWQDRTRDIEDRLSDALHAALTRRFVNRRAAMIARVKEDGAEAPITLHQGQVHFDTEVIGRLDGFHFSLCPTLGLGRQEKKNLSKAVHQALQQGIMEQIKQMETGEGRLSVTESGQIFWQKDTTNPTPGDVIGHVEKGDEWHRPKAVLAESGLLEGEMATQARTLVQQWLDNQIKTDLTPLFALKDNAELSKAAAGIAFQLFEGMGVIHRNDVAALIPDLDADQRRLLRRGGVRLGPMLIFMPDLIKPAAIAMRALLWGLYHGKALPVSRPGDGRVSETIDPKQVDHGFYRTIGYPVFGPRAVRIDMLDRVVTDIYDSADKGLFTAKNQYAEWLGCGLEEMYNVLAAMGHHRLPQPETPEGETPPPAQFKLKRGKVADKPERKKAADDSKKAKTHKKAQKKKPDQRVMSAAPQKSDDDNPFAILKTLQQK